MSPVSRSAATRSTPAWKNAIIPRVAGGTALALPGGVRRLALAVVSALTQGCFYTQVINAPPVAAIARLDPGTPVTPGPDRPLRVTASGSRDPDGDALTYVWRARVGAGDAHIVGGDTPQLSLPVLTHDEITVSVEVIDVHGATSSATITVPVGNRDPVFAPPVLTGSRNEESRFIFSLPVTITAAASDPDGDAISGYGFAVEPPPGAAAGPHGVAVPPDGWRLEPDVAGDWQVTITASDAYGGSATQLVTVSVAADAAPYIASTRPAWSAASRVILLRSAGPRRFEVVAVADDLDPYPATAGARFRWWVRLPGGPLAEVAGLDAAELTVDPAELDAGDVLDVRVEVADRVARALPCPAAQPACSLTANDRYQRITWTVEVR
jgi:hypothetical protein